MNSDNLFCWLSTLFWVLNLKLIMFYLLNDVCHCLVVFFLILVEKYADSLRSCVVFCKSKVLKEGVFFIKKIKEQLIFIINLIHFCPLLYVKKLIKCDSWLAKRFCYILAYLLNILSICQISCPVLENAHHCFSAKCLFPTGYIISIDYFL